MSASIAIRKTHRWISVLFVLTVVANFAAMAIGPPPAWIICAPLMPLALLALGGACLFVPPYRAQRK